MTSPLAPSDLTVVVPARDASSTVVRTVRSILEQRPGPPRVVVVDDGSSDDTAERAAAAGADVIVQPGAGPGAARNRGVAATTTHLVAFCDADDIWPPGRLAHDLRVLDERQAIDVLLGRTRFDADEPALVEGMELDAVDGAALIPHFGAVTARTSVFTSTGPIDPTLRSYEDYDWFLRVRERGLRLVAHPSVALWRRMHTTSTSQQHPASTRDLLATLQRSVHRRRADGSTAEGLPTLQQLLADDLAPVTPAGGTPRVSVIIPAWNAARHLAATLESVRAQSVADVEIIVVDDGSDDDTVEVGWRAGGDRCVVVRQPKRGIGASRNAGLALAQGDVIAHLDADDLWPIDRLALLLASLDEHPEVDAVFGAVVEFADEDAPTRAHVETTPRSVRTATAGLIRREAHLRSGGFRNLPTGDQIDWTARAVEGGMRYALISDVVLHRRIHARNNSHLFPAGSDTRRVALLHEMLQRRRAAADQGTADTR